ncbi:hypothetical protein Bca52824_039459 [Brassica carinata]|uniref:Uncharacterized protein n=1 Tax=Brassica carinata TaxID=52824 RepID=A0A8X7RR60_BRACI|nr:hypothetical protein Bca52824_039459 [Brassica carinata]
MRRCPHGGDRPELLYSASAQAEFLVPLIAVEECIGQYPGIPRGRILARPEVKLRILMLDSTGLACASRAYKGCNGLSRVSMPVSFMFVFVPGDNLVDSCTAICPEVSHNQCWDNLALCSLGTEDPGHALPKSEG